MKSYLSNSCKTSALFRSSSSESLLRVFFLISVWRSSSFLMAACFSSSSSLSFSSKASRPPEIHYPRFKVCTKSVSPAIVTSFLDLCQNIFKSFALFILDCTCGPACGSRGCLLLFFSVIFAITIHISSEIAAVGQGVEVQALRTGEGVGYHATAGDVQAPKILLATLGMWEKSFVLALIGCKFMEGLQEMCTNIAIIKKWAYLAHCWEWLVVQGY